MDFTKSELFCAEFFFLNVVCEIQILYTIIYKLIIIK